MKKNENFIEKLEKLLDHYFIVLELEGRASADNYAERIIDPILEEYDRQNGIRQVEINKNKKLR